MRPCHYHRCYRTGRVWPLPAQPRVRGAAVAGAHALEAQALRAGAARLDERGALGCGAGAGAPGCLRLPAAALSLHRGRALPVHRRHRRQPAAGGVWRRPGAGESVVRGQGCVGGVGAVAAVREWGPTAVRQRLACSGLFAHTRSCLPADLPMLPCPHSPSPHPHTHTTHPHHTHTTPPPSR